MIKRLTVLALTNALVLIVLASVAASAQTWDVTYTAATDTINGSPFTIVPPAATASVPLSSVHTAKIKNVSGATQTPTISISLRLFADPGGGSTTTYDSKYVSQPGPWADGDSYYINGVFPNGVSGGQLTTNLSGTKDLGLGSYTAHSFTHIMIGLMSYNKDDTTKTFQVKN